MPPGIEALYRAALGPSAARVYLPVFARFETRGRSEVVWSLRAALGNLAWLVYWRLWGAVLAQAGLTVAAVAALGWLWMRADGVPLGVRVGLAATAGVLWLALPGLWGVAWLHAGLRRRTVAAVGEAGTFKEAVERLARSQSAWRPRGMLAAAAVVLAVALLGGVVWPLWREPVTMDEQASALSPPTQPPATEPGLPPVPVPVPAPAEAAPALAPPEAAVASPAAEPAANGPLTASAESAIRPRVHGFGVNVGMFAVVANAERVKARLAEAGLPVLDDPIESARGPLTRVRVGPFKRREEAEAAARAVRALGLEARVYAP